MVKFISLKEQAVSPLKGDKKIIKREDYYAMYNNFEIIEQAKNQYREIVNNAKEKAQQIIDEANKGSEEHLNNLAAQLTLNFANKFSQALAEVENDFHTLVVDVCSKIIGSFDKNKVVVDIVTANYQNFKDHFSSITIICHANNLEAFEQVIKDKELENAKVIVQEQIEEGECLIQSKLGIIKVDPQEMLNIVLAVTG